MRSLIRPTQVRDVTLFPFNNVFDDLFDDRSFFHPIGRIEDFNMKSGMDMDVKQTESSIEIIADLPGVKKDNIQIDYDSKSNLLTISGSREESTSSSSSSPPNNENHADANNNQINDNKSNEKFICNERRSFYGKTTRSVRLPKNVDIDSIKASLDSGELNITIPKKDENEYTKKIMVE